MTRYAQNGGLTRFDEGKSHQENPLGGIPIGRNNSVEENETKSGNFVYSDRIVLDNNIVSQYNLPKSLVGKSVADATKFIDDKFKGRNDKISQSTKNGMLSKIAEAQESMKPQEPEMVLQENMVEQSSEMMGDSSQMALGGYVNRQMSIGGNLDQNGNPIPIDTVDSLKNGIGSIANSGQMKDSPISKYLNVATTGLDLGKTAFGKPAQNIEGLAPSAQVNSGGMIAGSTLKGLQAGMGFGPLGAGIGAVVGAGAGILGSNKAKKAAFENASNFAINTNKQFSDQYGLGGEVTPIVENKQSWDTKKIVKYQPGVTHGENGTQGFYLYSKDPTTGGFNPERDREFVNQENMMSLQRTPQWKEYMMSQSKIQPIQMAEGGYLDNNTPYFMKNPGIITQSTNMIPSLGLVNELKPVGTTTPYTIDTQPKVDISNANRQFTQGPSNLDMLKYNAKKVGKYVNDNASNIARYAPIAANTLQLAQLKKPQGERLDRLSNRYKPEYVDETALQNIADQTMNNSVNAIGQSGASQGQLRSSIIGSQLQRTKALSNAYSNATVQNRATNDRAQTFNLGVDQVNLQQSNTEKDINARDQAAYRNEKSKYISAIGNDIGAVGKEEIYKKIAKTTTGYSWLGEYQKMNPNATPEETKAAAEKAGVLTDGTTKKALGGYLLKNKRK